MSLGSHAEETPFVATATLPKHEQYTMQAAVDMAVRGALVAALLRLLKVLSTE